LISSRIACRLNENFNFTSTLFSWLIVLIYKNQSKMTNRFFEDLNNDLLSKKKNPIGHIWNFLMEQLPSIPSLHSRCLKLSSNSALLLSFRNVEFSPGRSIWPQTVRNKNLSRQTRFFLRSIEYKQHNGNCWSRWNCPHTVWILWQLPIANYFRLIKRIHSQDCWTVGFYSKMSHFKKEGFHW